MKIINTLTILKKCAGEARWSRYKTLKDKFEVFKILLRLRYYSEINPVNHTPVSQKIFGFKVVGFTYAELLYLFREIFLEAQYKFDSDKKSPEILDGGANIGMAVLFFKQRFPGCHILAFEPNPKAFACLKKNVEDNGLQNVSLINVGLSAEEGSTDFYIDEKNSLISSIDKHRGGHQAISVNFIKLSNAIRERKFDFAKIDVEGAEYEIVSDLNSNQSIQQIAEYIFEYHHNMQGSENRLSDFLRIFEQNNYQYNLMTTFDTPGEFQDIRIHCFRKS